MATIRTRINKKGVSYQVDYRNSDGKRIMKCFNLKEESEAFLSEIKGDLLMGVTIRQKEKGENNPWWVFVAHKGRRWSKKVGAKATAEKISFELLSSLALYDLGLGVFPTGLIKERGSQMDQKVSLSVHDKRTTDSMVIESIDVLNEGSGVTAKQILKRLGCDTKADPSGNSDYGVLMKRLSYLVDAGELIKTKIPNNVNTYRRRGFSDGPPGKPHRPMDRLDDDDAFVDEDTLVKLVEKMFDDLVAKDKIIEHLSTQNEVLREDKERYERLSRHHRTQKIKDALVRYGEMS